MASGVDSANTSLYLKRRQDHQGTNIILNTGALVARGIDSALDITLQRTVAYTNSPLKIATPTEVKKAPMNRTCTVLPASDLSFVSLSFNMISKDGTYAFEVSLAAPVPVGVVPPLVVVAELAPEVEL